MPATKEKTDTTAPAKDAWLEGCAPAARAAWLKGCAGIATYANVSHRTAQSWLSGGLKARRLTARLVLVRPQDVDAFIIRQSEERASRRGEVES